MEKTQGLAEHEVKLSSANSLFLALFASFVESNPEH